MTDALSHATLYAYDAFGNMIKLTDALGHDTLYTYDSNGHKLSETTTRTTPGGPQVLVTTWVYDSSGRVVQLIHPDGSSTQKRRGPPRVSEPRRSTS